MSEAQSLDWITWFCQEEGHEFFVKVDKQFMLDQFNLYRLPFEGKHFMLAFSTISGEYSGGSSSTQDNIIADYNNAKKLYGLIHARYILTLKGMQEMRNKYLYKVFGTCPRLFCEKQAVLPIGLWDQPGRNGVLLYCPKCADIYYPRRWHYTNLDGAYFGVSFSHMFFMEFPELRPFCDEN